MIGKANKTHCKAKSLILFLLPLMMENSAVHANEAIALNEMATLANGLNAVVFDTTYFVSLENLNDLSNPNTTIPYDSIQHLGGVYTISPQLGVFSTFRRNLANAFLSWNDTGYVIFQQGRTQTGTTPYDQGSPLDPWGHPYLFYNPLGLIRGDQGIITLEYHGDLFDRYTLASLGADGVVSVDDVIYQFGPGLNGSYLTSLNGEGVTRISPVQQQPVYEVEAGTTVTLRGINFGPETGDKHVVFGQTVIEDVLSWGNREVTVTIPETLTGTDLFRIQLGTTSTNGTTATITGSNTTVPNWHNY